MLRGYESDAYASYKNFDVRLLSGIDVATTKIGRLDDADVEDIQTIVRHGVSKRAIRERAERMLKENCYANAEEARKRIKIFTAIAEDW